MNKRILTLIISLFILFALPTISLYYSFQGSQFRKRALAELKIKSMLPGSIANQVNTDARYRIFISNCSDSSSINELINQFIEEKVDFVFLNDTIRYRNMDPNQLIKWNKKRALLTIEQSDFNLSPCEILLSNGKHEVLNSYNLLDSENRKKLIEHVAFLITKK